MPPKSSESLAKRFSGKHGASLLKDCILRQAIVAGNSNLAGRLIRAGTRCSYGPADRITTQGADDNCIYLLISGRVRIEVNSTEVAVRGPGTHFGEMALIDPTSVRSASVVAIDPVVALRITELRFTKIANAFPEVWRRIANELAARLRERAKFHRSPNAQAVVFIGSSSEGLDVAKEIGDFINSKGAIAKLWSEGVFQASKTAIEDLWQATKDCDFAVLVLTPDDKTTSRGKLRPAPRDNVIFELGLFVGALGRLRSVIVCPTQIGLKIPTDLLGVTTIQYSEDDKQSLKKRLSRVKRQLWSTIAQHGPR